MALLLSNRVVIIGLIIGLLSLLSVPSSASEKKTACPSPYQAFNFVSDMVKRNVRNIPPILPLGEGKWLPSRSERLDGHTLLNLVCLYSVEANTDRIEPDGVFAGMEGQIQYIPDKQEWKLHYAKLVWVAGGPKQSSFGGMKGCKKTKIGNNRNDSDGWLECGTKPVKTGLERGKSGKWETVYKAINSKMIGFDTDHKTKYEEAEEVKRQDEEKRGRVWDKLRRSKKGKKLGKNLKKVDKEIKKKEKLVAKYQEEFEDANNQIDELQNVKRDCIEKVNEISRKIRRYGVAEDYEYEISHNCRLEISRIDDYKMKDAFDVLKDKSARVGETQQSVNKLYKEKRSLENRKTEIIREYLRKHGE